MAEDTIVRKEFATGQEDCAIHVTTERLPEGRWGVVAAIKQRSDRGEKTIDLPVPEETFESQADAEDFGARMGLDWLDRNAPRAAA